MSDLKISQLPELYYGEVQNGDYLPVVDISSGVTKKVRSDSFWMPVTDTVTAQAAIATNAKNDVLAMKTEIRNWYYGPLASDPLLRPDGTAVQVGDEYHNSVNHVRKVYSNGAWVDIAVDAVNAATAAQASRVAAEVARDAAQLSAGVYATTAAGLAATTSGRYFSVPAAGSTEYLILYLNSSGTAVEVKRYPSAAAFDDIYRERLMARRAEWVSNARLRPALLPNAAVVILLGQSNNAPRGTAISGTVSRDVFMPVAGNSITYFPYNASNATWAMAWADVASAVQHTEGGSETPCSGVAVGLLGGQFQRVYIASAAIGARDLDTLRAGGPVQNLNGLVHRLCDLARVDGYNPVVMFDTHHGEADAAKSASETDYYADGWAYYRQAQAFAAQAMGNPDYDAPVVFHMPVAYAYLDNMRNVARAIVRLAKDLPNGILAGGSYQFPTEADRVHQEEDGFRQRGEQGGFLLRRFFDGFERRQSLQIVDATWSGATTTVIFNREITRDTGVDYGTNLNATNALAGLEFLDDGAFIKINTITVQGRVATLALASTPVGTTQHVQIASQTITGALTAGSSNLPGSQIRAAAAGEPSIYTPVKVISDFATPQKFEARP